MIDKGPESNPSTTTVRRYAPPNQRNRVLNRRKSGGDRYERTNTLYGSEGDKSQAAAASRNLPATDHGEAGSSNIMNENPRPGLINIEGCCSSEAAQLLSDRWAAAMHSYNDPSIDLSERPVMYSGATAAAWGHSKLPHQMDFLTQLRQAISSNASNASVDA